VNLIHLYVDTDRWRCVVNTAISSLVAKRREVSRLAEQLLAS
jgi:hypothetical protein